MIGLKEMLLINEPDKRQRKELLRVLGRRQLLKLIKRARRARKATAQ
jgi:hypothetical protein